MKKFMSAIGGLLACLLCVGVAGASVFELDRFSVTKNDTMIFNDEFDNGVSPPDAPNYSNGNSARYSVVGDVGPENVGGNGRLAIDTSMGRLITSSTTGNQLLFQRVRLQTNTNNTNLTRGLKVDDKIKVEGLYDFIAPETNENYGVRLTDFGSGNPANDLIDFSLRRNSSGELVIRYAQLDTIDGSVDVLGTYALSEPAFDFYDQIMFELFTGAYDNTVTASFHLLDYDSSVADISYSFASQADIFTGENWTRAEFVVRNQNPVPEPSTMILFGIGLLGVAGVGRRKITQF